MFGIMLMGIATSLVQMIARVVADLSAAGASTIGVVVSIPLGLAQGLEYSTALMGQTLVVLLKALTCGLL